MSRGWPIKVSQFKAIRRSVFNSGACMFLATLICKMPPKFSVYGFFILIAGSFSLMRNYPITAFVTILVSAIFLYGTRDLEAGARLTAQDLTVVVMFYAPTFFALGYIYNDEAESRHFKKYLVAHNCVFSREDVVRVSTGACDNRTGMCDDGGDTMEAVYACPNSNEITLREFAAGGSGVPSE
jgi:hypothetical protein